jgi:hypothetical protein
VSATISAEERRMSQIIIASAGAAGATVGGPAAPGTDGTIPNGSGGAGYAGWQSPDIAGNIRYDSAAFSAQVMAAAHDVNPAYYGTTPITGHPGDQWGWVVGGGLKINTPFVSPGDYFVAEVNYTEGATKYLWNASNNAGENAFTGGTEGFGVGSDCVAGGTLALGNATGCFLTTAWSVNAAYEHHWTPQWHQSFVGAYLDETYSSAANNILCSAEGFGQ